MQYDRNDEISYGEEFTTPAEKEYYSYSREDINSGNADVITEESGSDYRGKDKRNKPFPSVLFFQLVICLLCGIFLYVSKMYIPDVYNDIMDKVSVLINDSLIVDGNDLNDYFVNNG